MHGHGEAIGPRARWVGLAKLALLILVYAVFAEVSARAFWDLKYDISFRNRSNVIYAYYPELRAVDEEPPSRGDGIYDVLLLGGSVLNRAWGTVEGELRDRLQVEGFRPVRIHNMARPAHTSRDSLLKYVALKESRFDLVVFYHGINETRANNVPPELFREDYGHYGWYQQVNALAPSHGTSSLAVFPTLRLCWIKLEQLVRSERYIARDAPRADWIRHGTAFQSAQSFEQNVEAIVALSGEREEKLMLMTFAIHVPANYSVAAFRDKQLDYSLHRDPIELWGERTNVVGAIDAQNEAVRAIAGGQPNVLCVDQARAMPRNARHFNDPCHLTGVGSAALVRNLLMVLVPSSNPREEGAHDDVEAPPGLGCRSRAEQTSVGPTASIE